MMWTNQTNPIETVSASAVLLSNIKLLLSLWGLLCLSVTRSIYLSIHLPIYLCIYLAIYLSTFTKKKIWIDTFILLVFYQLHLCFCIYLFFYICTIGLSWTTFTPEKGRRKSLKTPTQLYQ